MNGYEIFHTVAGICSLAVPVFTICFTFLPKLRGCIQRLLGIQGLAQSVQDLDKKYDMTTDKIQLLTDSLTKHLKDAEKRQQTDVCLLREVLITKFKAFQDRGYITYDELETIQKAYEQYIALGGNGVIKHKWEEEILKLPVQ